MSSEFIDLNRHFSPMSRDVSQGDDHEMQVALGVSSSLRWPDIFEKRRVVILAEPGAGKTEEIKHATLRLRAEGKPAFFLRLEQIADDFELSFDIGSYDEFQAWLTTEDKAWFFLDSVDEARLTEPNAFSKAIRRFAKAISDQLQRCHIVVTSRVAEWRQQSDAQLLIGKLPYKPSIEVGYVDSATEPTLEANATTSEKYSEQKMPDIDVFSLAPLDRVQMQRFAEAKGITDAELFVSEIVRNDAEMFARLPLDLLELIDFWQDHRRVGRRYELVEASVGKKLKEWNSNHSDLLTLEQARSGAETLAAVSTLSRQSRLQLPNGGTSAEAIAVSDVLPNWAAPNIKSLLNRPIFDEAIYGTVRFHHRIVREYLCAQWFAKLLQSEMSRRSIEALFFVNMYGLEVVPSVMKPILPWLALKDDRIRARTLCVAPELLIDGGDSSLLPSEVRQQILKKYCAEFAHRTRGYHWFDHAAIKRFTHLDLTETIIPLLGRHRHNQDVAVMLLLMIEHGRLAGCWKIIAEIVEDTSISDFVRMRAINAVAAIGASEQCQPVVKMLRSQLSSANYNLASTLLDLFAPRYLDVDAVLSIVDVLVPPGRFEHRSIEAALESYVERLNISELRPLIEGLLYKIQSPPFIKLRYYGVSEVHGWLLRYATMAAERLVKARHPDALASATLAVISLSSLASHFDNYRSHKHGLRELVPAWSDLNYKLFWFDVAERRKELDARNGERLTDHYRVRIFRNYTILKTDDFEVYFGDIKDRELLDDRLVALSVAFDLYHDAGRPPAWRRRLKQQVANEAELEDQLHRYFHPPPLTEEMKKSRRTEARWKRQQRVQEKKDAENQENWVKWLSDNVRVLRDVNIASEGKVWNATTYLVDQLRHHKNDEHRWAVPYWRVLIPTFGEPVARAFRDGATAYWRAYNPPIRSEGIKHPNKIPNAVIVALTGVTIESAECADWPAALTDAEIVRATRLALWEMNGFPVWFKGLYKHRGDLVRPILEGEIKWELTANGAGHDDSYVLTNVHAYENWLQEDLAPLILNCLAGDRPVGPNLFQTALSVVLNSDCVTNEVLCPLVAKHAKTTFNPTRKAVWMAAWMGLDPEPTFAYLEGLLEKIGDEAEAQEFALHFAVSLLGEHWQALQHQRIAYCTAQWLHRLYELLYRYIRPEDDIQRVDSGAYALTLRDYGQRARDNTFSLLRDIPGKATYIALRSIDVSAAAEHRQQWMMYHARTRAEADADGQPWKCVDVLAFAAEYERQPKTNRELFELTVARLNDLKLDLEHGDSSNASILITISDEAEHRKYIGNWLRDRAHGRYIVPQEEELADRKRPDIRIHGVGFDAPVPTELKVSNRCSGTQLFERLECQLIGDYLRDDRSGCGVYLLINRGTKKNWEHPATKAKMDFPALLEALQQKANQLIADRPDVEIIRVLGLDLTRRNCPRA